VEKEKEGLGDGSAHPAQVTYPLPGQLQDQDRGPYGVMKSIGQCHDPSTAIELSLYPH